VLQTPDFSIGFCWQVSGFISSFSIREKKMSGVRHIRTENTIRYNTTIFI